MGTFFAFVNGAPDKNGNMVGLLPYLKDIKNRPDATPHEKVISEVMTGVERVRIDCSVSVVPSDSELPVPSVSD